MLDGQNHTWRANDNVRKVFEKRRHNRNLLRANV